SPKRTPQAMEAEVVRIRAGSNNAWGGRKIRRVLDNGGMSKVPAASTITAILRRHGRLAERSTEHPGPYRRFERDEPNDLWQMDFRSARRKRWKRKWCASGRGATTPGAGARSAEFWTTAA